ncbi:LysM peptidoglycan-binding domain-containing protein [Lacticaseibacillus baoqingensis]|uniref:LysM peptidoglycan-binding domain-containing protein n=1 Tax=Lacticaseibacillus baoqingensis TaxID=2486013 RepID=A0ABW4E8R5_9LACO|nr:LysM domain-containing protein [Lacticaseibacillus baoqingensis]
MRKKTTKKEESVGNDASDQTKPWNKQFEDDRDDAGNLSRVATRKKKRGTSILSWVVWIALALVIIVPVAYEAIHSNSNAGGGYSNDKITVTTSSKKKAASQKSATSKKKVASNHAKSSKHKAASQRVAASQKAAASSASASAALASSAAASRAAASSAAASSAAAQSQAASASKAAASSSSTAGGTYTVKAGDNLYRIAVNHGMTLSELLQLNGMSSGASIAAGQTLKVK